MIKVGTNAPDFTLEDNQGGTVSLKDLRGKKVLLSWHPLAWTSVCTDQMRALEVHHDRFSALGAIALGLSVDAAAGKKAWAAVLSIRNTKLLSDFHPHGGIAKAYGVFLEDIGASGRANLIVDEEGVVRWAKEYELGQLPDIGEVLEALERIGG